MNLGTYVNKYYTPYLYNLVYNIKMIDTSGREPPREVPLYHTLFTSFAGMAAVHGVLSNESFDTSFAPGQDGTLTPDGQAAQSLEHSIPSDQLPL